MNIIELNENLFAEIKKIKSILEVEFDENPYVDICSMLRLIESKNYSQYKSIEKKLKNLSISFYNRRLSNYHELNIQLEKSEKILTQILNKKIY